MQYDVIVVSGNDAGLAAATRGAAHHTLIFGRP